jgi:hypothetical protein
MNVNGVLRSLLCVSALCASVALAADAKQEPGSGAAFPKGQYGVLDKLPDWGGAWVLNFSPGREPPVLKGKYLELHKEWQRLFEANKGMVPRGGSNCVPPGMPGIMAVGQYPTEFLFTPGRITLLYEAWMQWRIIFTDGRPHPPADELEPTFYGHSIGRWEGETLIIDTVGIKDTVPLQAGMTHSDKLHIVERMYLAKDNPDTLVVDMVVEDPLALEKPWNRKFTYKRERDWNLVEFICAENDRNPVDESGKTLFDHPR